MNAINKIGLVAVGATVGILVVLYVLVAGGKWIWNSAREDRGGKAEMTEQLSAQNQKDIDQDGLPDMFENIYSTNINNPDTDGDGVGDLEELEAGWDPIIKGPNDESKPPTGEDIVNQDTYTQRYLALLPSDVKRSDILNKKSVEAFVNNNSGVLLPEIDAEQLKTSADTGEEAVKNYLQQISANTNPKIHSISNDQIEQALVDKLQLKPETMDAIIKQLEENVATLKGVAAPAEVTALHTKLVQATVALHENVQLLAKIDEDYIGSLIASKNIDELGVVYQQIAEEVSEIST